MQKLQHTLSYQFRDEALLALALTHPSLAKANNNQRLEFLGDAVLGLLAAKLLYELYPSEQEGELARRQAALVRGETLAKLARELGLGEALKMSASEAQAGGRDNASNLEDAMEALIGAMYLDGGLTAVEQSITPHLQTLAQHITSVPKDAKTALQEWAQARGLPVPTYTVLNTSGPAHAPEFTVEVRIEGHPPQSAKAANKRAAEQAAANMLLATIN